MGTLANLFRFPHPVNEVSARLVAGGVVLLTGTAIATQQRWLLVPIAYGFVARALAGPTYSPLGRLVTEVLTPRLPLAPKLVPGPPKRFAQGIGAALSTTALALAFLDLSKAAYAVLGVVTVAAALESVFAFCLGCKIFSVLMALRLIPESVCAECNAIPRRRSDAATA